MFGYVMRPLTPALSPEYGGEGVRAGPLSRLRERAGVRAEPWLNHLGRQKSS